MYIGDVDDIAGGASAKAKLDTYADKGKAGAYGSVKATGDISTGITNTKAKVISTPYHEISYSLGYAYGYGVTDYIDIKTDLDTGFSYSV